MVAKKKKGRSRIDWVKFYLGGAMRSGHGVAQPLNKSYLIAMEQAAKANKSKKALNKWDYVFNWGKVADNYFNKNVLDEASVNEILRMYNSGEAGARERAIDKMRELLTVNDIHYNPEDYLKEFEKGKHRRNKWGKYLGYGAQAAATAAALYAGYKFGPGLVRKLFGSSGADAGGTAGVGDAKLSTGNIAGNTINKIAELTDSDKARVAKFMKSAGAAGENNLLTLKGDAFEAPGKIANSDLWRNIMNNNGGFDLSSADNPGFLGINSAGQALVRNDAGTVLTIDQSHLPSHIMNNPRMFQGFLSNYNLISDAASQGNTMGFLDRIRRLITGSGYRRRRRKFRMTKKGRHLYKKYRRHMRR